MVKKNSKLNTVKKNPKNNDANVPLGNLESGIREAKELLDKEIDIKTKLEILIKEKTAEIIQVTDVVTRYEKELKKTSDLGIYKTGELNSMKNLLKSLIEGKK